METGKGVAGWSVFMALISAGVTYYLTDGDMGLVILAFLAAAVITALIGPTFVAFLVD